MRVRALVSFAGVVGMAKDEIRDIKDKATCKDLLKAGHVEKVTDSKNDEEQQEGEN